MRPKNKKHNFSRTDNKKYQEQNHKKEKTNNNNTNTIYCCFFIAFASTIQFSHNTPPHKQHPTTCDPRSKAATSKKVLLNQGVIYRTTTLCCPRHPTACQTTKQTIKTQTHLPKPLKTRGPALFHWSPHTRNACGTCFHLQTKKLATTRY